MQNLPVVGKQYTDRSGFTVIITSVEPTARGAAVFGRGERKGKNIGYRIEMAHKGVTHSMGMQIFTQRGFKEDAGTV